MDLGWIGGGLVNGFGVDWGWIGVDWGGLGWIGAGVWCRCTIGIAIFFVF